ncbi:MAG: hypothetical protein HY540_02640 [Deltaproteobacteria bacterium]|nr:hypothetical protein [Deltaproteobacteria bacterium]
MSHVRNFPQNRTQPEAGRVGNTIGERRQLESQGVITPAPTKRRENPHQTGYSRGNEQKVPDVDRNSLFKMGSRRFAAAPYKHPAHEALERGLKSAGRPSDAESLVFLERLMRPPQTAPKKA